MKKLATIISSGVLTLAVLVAMSGRGFRELFGYVKATADTTVNELESSVPASVRDQKVRNDIEQARGEVIDRRVRLSLVESEIQRLNAEVCSLSTAVDRRKSILAEAFPTLKQVTSGSLIQVRFAGEDWTASEFSGEIDRQLLEQDRDEKQLSIRREALDRLTASVEEGRIALSEMQTALTTAEDEFNTLVTRREQASNESETLDLITAVGRNKATVTAAIGSGLEDLRSNVEKAEATNIARRELAPARQQPSSKLSVAWARLERLKSLHNQTSAFIEKPKSIEHNETEVENPKSAVEASSTNPGNGESVSTISPL